MPFLKYTEKISHSRQVESTTAKNGWRQTVYGLNGSKYIGNWKDNEKQGKGKILTKKQALYEGDWKGNKPSGYGVLCYPDANKKTFYLCYRGRFGHGQKNAKGVVHRHNGAYYVGDFKDGKRDGYGMLWHPDGSFYAGDFMNGFCHGSGTYVRTDGNRYDGEWKRGLKHGKGRFFHLNKGQMQSGIWVNDICVFSVLENIPYRQCSLFPTQYPITQTAMNDVKNFAEEQQKKLLTGVKDSCLAVGLKNGTNGEKMENK